MLRHVTLEHRFVHYIPDIIEPGVIYISVDYATAVHSCCCGCGEQVVTPISPNDWKLIFDGETVTLSPSIGNWNFPCRSHYFVRNGRIIEAEPWYEYRASDADFPAGEKRSLEPLYKSKVSPSPSPLLPADKPKSLWKRLKKKFRKKRS